MSTPAPQPPVESRSTTHTKRSWLRYFSQSRPLAGEFYDLCGENLLINRSDVALANMGYWEGLDHRTPDCLKKANFALFDRVNKAAKICAGDFVVDIGCGFGVNTMRIQSHYSPRRTVGVNVSSVQMEIARERTKAAGLSDRVKFVRADATNLPFQDNSIDRIVSTEAIFHFDTRAEFFQEAFRVLKPKGRIAVADLLPLPPPRIYQRPAMALTRRVLAIPDSAVTTPDRYRELVQDAGFDLENCQSIYSQVHPPFVRWQIRQTRGWLLYPWTVKLAVFGFFFCPWDYLELAAVKPKRASGAIQRALAGSNEDQVEKETEAPAN